MRIAGVFEHLRHWIRPGLLGALLCLLAVENLYAEDNWVFQPSITQNLSAETNPLMLVGSHATLWGSTTSPEFTFTDTSPTTKLTGKASIDENLFNQSDFDSTDLHGNVNLDKKLEQWDVGFAEQVDYDTTRTSELSTLDINSVGSVRHVGNNFSPVISFSPTVADKLSLAGSYQTSQYDSNLYTNYNVISLTPSYEYSYNQLNKIILSNQLQRYQADTAPSSRIYSIAPTLGWAAHLTPTWSVMASAGYEGYREQGDALPTEQWKWKGIFNGEIAYKGEEDTFSADASRALQPYANGTEYFLNTLSLSDSHAMNPLFTASGGASYQFADNSNQSSTNLRSLINANAGITYHATRKVDIGASYQYREQSLTNVPGNETDNVFMLSLVYRPVLSVLTDNQ